MALLWTLMHEPLFGCMLSFLMECGPVFNELCLPHRGLTCGRPLGGHAPPALRTHVVPLDALWVPPGHRSPVQGPFLTPCSGPSGSVWKQGRLCCRVLLWSWIDRFVLRTRFLLSVRGHGVFQKSSAPCQALGSSRRAGPAWGPLGGRSLSVHLSVDFPSAPPWTGTRLRGQRPCPRVPPLLPSP